jgi:hypothetical protein
MSLQITWLTQKTINKIIKQRWRYNLKKERKIKNQTPDIDKMHTVGEKHKNINYKKLRSHNFRSSSISDYLIPTSLY